jgi:hypothetical protein
MNFARDIDRWAGHRRRALLVSVAVAVSMLTLSGCSTGYPGSKGAPASIGAYKHLTPAQAWPVVVASGSLYDPGQYGSGPAYVKKYAAGFISDYASDSNAPSSRPARLASVTVDFYGKPNAAGALRPHGDHAGLMELRIYTLSRDSWTAAGAEAYTKYIKKEFTYNAGDVATTTSSTSFYTYDGFFAITKTGFIEGGLQLDSKSSTAKSNGAALMKQALSSSVG